MGQDASLHRCQYKVSGYDENIKEKLEEFENRLAARERERESKQKRRVDVSKKTNLRRFLRRRFPISSVVCYIAPHFFRLFEW